MENRVPLYVLNNFMKFERKLYQVFGLSLGRPLRLKAVGYFMIFGLIEIAIYFTPIIGNLINWIPFGVLLLIPIGLAWLLADVGTEGRSPMSFFKSFFRYQIRRIQGYTYFRGKKIDKERNYTFNNYYSYKESVLALSSQELTNINEMEEVRERALRYMQRIQDPDSFFSERKENKKRGWMIKRRKSD